jgi:PAS domain S-box-containing protein
MKLPSKYKVDAKPPVSGEAQPLVVDAIPGLIFTALPDGEIDFLNERWLEYTGMSVHEIQGRLWTATDLVHPGDLPRLMESWKSILLSKAGGEVDARFRRHDREYRWFLFRVVPFVDESGKLVRWYGTNTDIDDLKWAEALLAAEKRILEMIAKGDALQDILDSMCRLVEEMSGDSLTSILLLNRETNCLWHGSAPSLPESFTSAISGSAIGPHARSCVDFWFTPEGIKPPKSWKQFRIAPKILRYALTPINIWYVISVQFLTFPGIS